MPTFDPAALSQRLHQAGLRSTRAVLGVADLFEQAATHWQPTHADVAARLAQAGEPVNPVTLYRLLDRLVAAGLLARHTAPGERVWRFQWLGVAASAPESAPVTAEQRREELQVDSAQRQIEAQMQAQMDAQAAAPDKSDH